MVTLSTTVPVIITQRELSYDNDNLKNRIMRVVRKTETKSSMPCIFNSNKRNSLFPFDPEPLK